MVMKVLKRKKLATVELLLIDGVTGKTKLSTLQRKYGEGEIRSAQSGVNTIIYAVKLKK
jgi:hypothetical protein